MDELEAIKQTFFEECAELLAELEVNLIALQGGSSDSETINAIFRAVHSVKGGAGAFGLDELVAFAHVFETTLDGLRSGSIAASDALTKVLLQSADMLADHVAAARGGSAADAARSMQLADALAGFVADRAAPRKEVKTTLAAPLVSPLAAPDEWGFVPQVVAFADLDAAPAAPQTTNWQIVFRPHASLYAKANDPVLLLRELHQLGACTTRCASDSLPNLDMLEAEQSYLSWTIDLVSDRSKADIEDVFAFVDGDCDLSITQLEDLPVSPVSSASPVLPAPIVPQAHPQIDPPISELPAAQDALAPADEEPARRSANAQTGQGAAAAPAGASIRVDLDRIDRLIDLVGELVINQSMLSQRATEFGVPRTSSFFSALEDLEQLTRGIQDSVMAVRAQPVKSVFQRMPRLVREVAAMTGKQVRIETSGEMTEVDKTVIERLTDPLTHMIRNAIDHGIEGPEARLTAGKSPEGCVRLDAFHRSGRIVIEVADDGAGINRKKVLESARKKGLVQPDAALTDDEIDNLIFAPGFSTASEISNISGRGVGMDVVKRAIQALGGRITISSTPGQGSVFTLSLPLTLAVLDGMVVTVNGATYIIPLTAVLETLRPKSGEVRALGPSAQVVAVRDWHVPLVDLSRLLPGPGQTDHPSRGVCLLVESEVGGRAALKVDAIQGQRQVVIKSLEANYQRIDLIAAATILGDGRVALILDVDALIAGEQRERPDVMATIELAKAS